MSKKAIDAKSLDKSGAAGLNIAIPVFLQVFGLLVPPVYVSVVCWRARYSNYRNQLWGATFCLLSLILISMALNTIRKRSPFGLCVTLARSYALPVYILSLTLYIEYAKYGIMLFIILRGALSIFAYYAKPPPYTLGPDGQPQKLRVLLAGDSFFPKVDGVSTFSTHTIKHLQQHGHTVHVMTSKKGPTPLFGATVTRLPGVIPMTIDPHHSITMPIPWLIFPAIFHFKPHVVHVFESVVPFSLGMMLACWLLDIPLVISHHTRIDMYGKWFAWYVPTWLLNILLLIFYRGIITLGDLNIGVCPPLIDWLKWTRTPGGLEPEMWKSGCSVDIFTPENESKEMRERLTQGRPELPLIIYVGRMAQEKDSIELLPILRELYKRMNSDVRVALIGGGPMKERLEMEAQDDTFISFPGFLRGDELYSACMFLCLFSCTLRTLRSPVIYAPFYLVVVVVVVCTVLALLTF